LDLASFSKKPKTALMVSPALGHCEQQSLNGHAAHLLLPINLHNKSLLMHGMEKLDEDRSVKEGRKEVYSC